MLSFYAKRWFTLHHVCARGNMFPIPTCCQSMGKQNLIISVALVPLHFIYTSTVHGHLSLTPAYSHFLSLFEAAHVWPHHTALHLGSDCTKFCSTIHAEIYVALCRPGDQGGECAFIGVQFRHAAPDKTYHTCIRLQDHWVRNVRCGAWPEMASAKTCVV